MGMHSAVRVAKAPSPGSLTRSDLSPKGEVVVGRDLAHDHLSLRGRGRRAAAGEGAFAGPIGGTNGGF
jgi:hypothetical protein